MEYEYSQKSELAAKYNDYTSHYHITLKDITIEDLEKWGKKIYGKPTPIDLVDTEGKPFKDRMLTKHQKGISLVPMLMDVNYLNFHNIGIARYKLEMNLTEDDMKPENLGLPLNSLNYIETHVKVPHEFKRIDNFPGSVAISSNPKSMGYYFYNMRARSYAELDSLLEGLDMIYKEAYDSSIIVETHREYSMMDSKSSHDSWWL